MAAIAAGCQAPSAPPATEIDVVACRCTDPTPVPRRLNFVWSAIGRVTSENESLCSAVLVSSRIAVTAAHCLFDDDGRRIEAVSFQSARGGHVEAASPITETVIPPQFDLSRFVEGSDLDRYDYAFLVLEWPLGNSLGTVGIQPLDELSRDERDFLVEAGYGNNSPDQISATIGCRLLRDFADGTFSHNCLAEKGDSGGPILAVGTERATLIGIDSYTSSDEEGHTVFSVAVAANGFRDELNALESQLSTAE